MVKFSLTDVEETWHCLAKTLGWFKLFHSVLSFQKWQEMAPVGAPCRLGVSSLLLLEVPSSRCFLELGRQCWEISSGAQNWKNKPCVEGSAMILVRICMPPTPGLLSVAYSIHLHDSQALWGHLCYLHEENKGLEQYFHPRILLSTTR